MNSRKRRDTNLPAPYLKQLSLDPATIPDREAYPFCLPSGFVEAALVE